MPSLLKFPFLHSKSSIEDIDRGSMLRPPIPRDWDPKKADEFRFEWDPKYVKIFNQNFSPWNFAKNCAAVLGYTRRYGRSVLMCDMADCLVDVLAPHIQTVGLNRYVRNSFPYHYLHHKIRPGFYGAFMNNVSAYGLLYLFEATGDARHLLLADRLLATSVDPIAVFPLSSHANGDFWLHEYVFRTDDSGGWADIQKKMVWSQARIYNGHIHALLPLMRIRVMTGSTEYDRPIKMAIDTMKRWLPRQSFDGKFFSYSPDMPIFPDYGQKRALHLMESLAQLTGDEDISSAASKGRDLWVSIDGREKDIISAAMNEANAKYRTFL